MDTFDLPVLNGGAPSCEGCAAHCCRYVSVEIDRPKTKWQYDQIRWMLLHQDISVYVAPDGEWFVEFETRCRELGEDNLCQSYGKRPDLCRKYIAEECPVWNPASPHQVEFRSADELTAWLDSRKIDWRLRAHEERPEPAGQRAMGQAE